MSPRPNEIPCNPATREYREFDRYDKPPADKGHEEHDIDKCIIKSSYICSANVISFSTIASVLPICKFTVTAQEGPGIVIAHPGQDVELLCTVTEDSTTQTEGWVVNNMGPYRINALRNGILIRHNASLDGGNLMVENITRNDNRSGSEYICVIVPAEGMITLDDIIYESDPTILYVAGEYIVAIYRSYSGVIITEYVQW